MRATPFADPEGLFAGLFSTIRFVANRGEAFAHGLIYSTGPLVLPWPPRWRSG